MQLIIEPIGHIISTMLIQISIPEMEKLKVVVETLTDIHLKYDSITINFDVVAEIKYVHAEFYEMEMYEILNKGTVEDTHFYQVHESVWLKANKIKYDPRNRLDLKHYLIVGQYSYVEVLAAKYAIGKTTV